MTPTTEEKMHSQYMQLKWTQLGADAPFILAKDEATCFAASDKLHALGCCTGTVHVLDFEGNQVRSFAFQLCKRYLARINTSYYRNCDVIVSD
jgi:hypothetical protein